MIRNWLMSAWNDGGHLYFAMILVQIHAAAGLVLFTDWRARRRRVRRESSIQALEALFQLPDLRAAQRRQAR
jgi:hypothetical protein